MKLIHKLYLIYVYVQKTFHLKILIFTILIKIISDYAVLEIKMNKSYKIN